jgi:hypothetical protein
MTPAGTTLHYVWIPEPGKRPYPLPFPLYVCMASALKHLRPRRTILWSDRPPMGRDWEMLQDRIEVRALETDIESWGGKRILQPAHMADKVRLDVLYRYGGIYLDLDVLVLKPFDDLLGSALVMGEEGDHGLCNAVMIAPEQDPFLRLWMSHYPRSFVPDGWSEASVILPRWLAQMHGDLIRVLPESAFFHPSWHQCGRVFREPEVLLESSYACHLWASLAQEVLEQVSRRSVGSGRSHFDRIAREYV